MARGPSGQAQPACGEDAQQVAVTEEEDVPVDGPQSGDHTVSTGAHHLDRLAARTAIAEEIPARTLLANVSGAPTLVLAVIPLLQICIDLGLAAEARQFACPPGPRQWTRQDPGEHCR